MSVDFEAPLSIPDLPSGPLDAYRSQATFDWKMMRVYMEGKAMLKVKVNLWNIVAKDRDFNAISDPPISLDALRRRTNFWVRKFNDMKLLRLEEVTAHPGLPITLFAAMILFDPSVTVKYALSFALFENTIRALGTQKHAYFLDDLSKEKINACFALTEIGHGSNTRAMQCRADYDPQTDEFVLHSSNFESAKCWAGGLGKTATHALVYAQLYTPDGVNHGLHCFVVPLRDPATHLPLPGVTVGDMGEKIGLNGIDNGFMLFDKYRIPRDNLLNKLGDVTPSGQYVSAYKDPSQRLGLSLGQLSFGRVSIMTTCTVYLTNAVTIAVRYSAVRKQFGPSEGQECAVLEYQLQQWRLFPYLAVIYAFKTFADYLSEIFGEFSMKNTLRGDLNRMDAIGVEIHSLSSGAKPLFGWVSQRGIQDCRESCGGHGYLKAAGIGQLRNDNDANCTYEGENNVLIQQTSNWLLTAYKGLKQGRPVETPLGSGQFLNSIDTIIQSKFAAKNIEEAIDPQNIIKCYDWLVCWLLQSTAAKLEQNLKKFGDAFTAKNESQAYYARTLSIAFIERFVIVKFYEKASNSATDPSLRHVLLRLCSLYGAWALEQHLTILYQGGFVSCGNEANFFKEGVLALCASLKPEAVSLVDALAPPDHILRSVLGQSDGNVYKNLQAAIFQGPEALQRPSWWREITNWQENLQSKL